MKRDASTAVLSTRFLWQFRLGVSWSGYVATLSAGGDVAKQRITPAQRRALEKAAKNGLVMIDGSFSGKPDGLHHKKEWDRRMVIRACVSNGWLQTGKLFNQYILTGKGREALP